MGPHVLCHQKLGTLLHCTLCSYCMLHISFTSPPIICSWMNASAKIFNWACQISGKDKECSCVLKQANLFMVTLWHVAPSLVASSFLKRSVCLENTNVYSWSHFQQFVMPAIGLWLPALRILIILQGCSSCTCLSIEMYREI